MSEEKNKEFFSDFTLIREKKGITLEDIVKRTKLQKSYIEAIENGNFNVLPEVYIKLFLKTYANFLDLDAKDILKSYNEYISGKPKKRRVAKSSTPQFIENKETFKDKIDPNFKTNLYKSSYFIGPKKIISVLIFLVLVIICWTAVASFNNYKEDYEIVKNNEPINWDFYKDTNKFELFDSQKIKIVNLDKSNSYKFETKSGLSNASIIGTEINQKKFTAEGKDYHTSQWEGLTQFGIRNGNIIFFINNSIIEFNHTDKAIWGIIDPEESNVLTIKYYSYIK